MKTRNLMGLVLVGLVCTACPTSRELDATMVDGIRGFAPNAIASSTQFLRGAPVDLNNSIDFVIQGAQNEVKSAQLAAKIPATITTAFSITNLQKSLDVAGLERLGVLGAKLGIQPLGTNCGGGNVSDQDSDGIPDNFNYPFNCSTTYGTYAASLTGRVVIDDLNDNNPLSGYDIRVEDLTFMFSDTQTNDEYMLRTNYNVKVRPGVASGKFTVDQTFRYEARLISGGKVATFEYAYSGTLEFTPAPNATAANRFARGTLKFRNKFRFDLKSPSLTAFSELQMETTGLEVDRTSCGANSMVSSGAVTFTDGKNILKWTVASCDPGVGNSVGNWEYNGQPLTND
jgi:hypothetical protein